MTSKVNQLLNPRWGGRVDPEVIACLPRYRCSADGDMPTSWSAEPVLEVKSGRLDRVTYILQLINQLIGYGLLAHFNGHTVTHVAVYAVRYQRVLRFRIEPLLTRLAGRRLSLDTVSADSAEAVDNRRHGTTAA